MPQFSTIVADIISRLTYHTVDAQVPARMLDGWKFEAVPVASVEGLKDLPALRLYLPDVKGDYRPARNEQSEMEFRMIVATKREDGLVAHFQAVEKVMDALNYTPAGVLTNAFAGTAKPWSWKTSDNNIVDSSLNSQITIIIEPKVVELGKRRL